MKEELFVPGKEALQDEVYECIILAGGMGTRLQDVVPDLPKVLAPVAGKPFLAHVINFWSMQGIRHFIFSLGHKAGAVEQFLKEQYPSLSYVTVIEDQSLGTGGAVRLALQKTKSDHVVITNGDTLFKVDLTQLYEQHLATKAECSLALKSFENNKRFGNVAINDHSIITAFGDTSAEGKTLINGGVYVLDKARFFQRSYYPTFSFEKHYLETYTSEGKFCGIVQDKYFIDIGIPADYQIAQQDLAVSPLNLKEVDQSWTLFIDRDGVINNETIGEYILHWEQFIFSKGVLHSFKKISDVFGRIFLVTNQRGVGKGLMKAESLATIHYEMQREIEIVGGRIDKIYACTEDNSTCFHRKPNPGMAWQAKRDFPEIDFTKSIMVGNKLSDMQFGRAAGMYTVFLATTNPEEPFPHPAIDLRFPTLADFAAAL